MSRGFSVRIIYLTGGGSLSDVVIRVDGCMADLRSDRSRNAPQNGYRNRYTNKQDVHVSRPANQTKSYMEKKTALL